MTIDIASVVFGVAAIETVLVVLLTLALNREHRSVAKRQKEYDFMVLAVKQGRPPESAAVAMKIAEERSESKKSRNTDDQQPQIDIVGELRSPGGMSFEASRALDQAEGK